MFRRRITGVIVDQAIADLGPAAGSEQGCRDSWPLSAYRDFLRRVSDQAFPCLFGRSGLKRGGLKFLFVGSDRHEVDLVAGMASYTAFVRRTPIDARLYSPLIVIFEPTHYETPASERAFCWKQLEILHRNDPRAWPPDVPKDPHDSKWSFCFDGMQLFVNMSCPHHIRMRSRNLGERITFVVNPRENFDHIANVNSKKGVRVRESIRDRVRAYNDGLVPPELGFFGDGKNLEWKQYQLNEPGAVSQQTCPWRHTLSPNSQMD